MVLNSGKTKDSMMLNIVREIAFIAFSHNFQIRAVHLAGQNNRIADGLSRAPLEPGFKLGNFVDKSWERCVISNEDFRINDSR